MDLHIVIESESIRIVQIVQHHVVHIGEHLNVSMEVGQLLRITIQVVVLLVLAVKLHGELRYRIEMVYTLIMMMVVVTMLT